ncbi:metallophosphoesterase [Subsaxibacter sp. CAU 1640]|uniref:metallophosphoesterase n=1 Tax=Subsaxibacter sp. CAU 1640 TaxID=2933271 RepID=UPI002005FCFA|nr:metallophosphoesterase [Subsaxibacter sp. CAU 1640]MCK7589774.1 metallophosphoesterase [Subsaxibacter sp. CAU 1640]
MRWIVFIIIYILLNFYGFQAIKTVSKLPWLHYLFIGIALLIVGNFVIQFTMTSEGRVLSPAKSYAFGFLLSFILFNLVLVIFLFGEDIVRFIIGINEKLFGSTKEYHAPSRRKFISSIALGIAAIPFASMLYGMYRGKYNYRVLKYILHFEDLPEAFDGYRITQISDIHSGSFDNREKIEYGVNLIKEQQSDVIFFTGDLVNNKTSEMLPWKDLFSELKAKDGVYSVLGNHDYGDYIDWKTEEEKTQNLEDLKFLQKEMGYDLLLNDSRFIERNGQRIAIVGVENWGKGGFKKAGDLKKASEKIDANDFKILLSHDPSHWDEVVTKDDYHYHLTLSGHTHGMQFGIEIPGWVKWSPIKWRYKHWAGIYKELGQYINVNRGFGYLGYPGRVGIWPEVTVIELKKGPDSLNS